MWLATTPWPNRGSAAQEVIASFQGAKKGLIVNSTDLCARKHSADVQLEAHNGKRLRIEPVVGASCKKR